MKGYTKKHAASHGNEKQKHSIKKHDANLRKNGLLHFQIGLILSLLMTYFVIETTFPLMEANVDEASVDLNEYVIEEEPVPPYEVYQEPSTEPVIEENVALPIEVFNVIEVISDDDTKLKPSDTSSAENLPSTDIPMGDIIYDAPTVDTPIPFVSVEFVPVFPGCESLTTNEERRDCMSKSISKIIQQNFNTTLGEVYGLSGKLRIDVQFKIDKKGLVSDVKVRAPHPGLETEAKRVANLIPQMKPGMQRDRKVEVIFMKPIIFKVQ